MNLMSRRVCGNPAQDGELAPIRGYNRIKCMLLVVLVLLAFVLGAVFWFLGNRNAMDGPTKKILVCLDDVVLFVLKDKTVLLIDVLKVSWNDNGEQVTYRWRCRERGSGSESNGGSTARVDYARFGPVLIQKGGDRWIQVGRYHFNWLYHNPTSIWVVYHPERSDPTLISASCFESVKLTSALNLLSVYGSDGNNTTGRVSNMETLDGHVTKELLTCAKSPGTGLDIGLTVSKKLSLTNATLAEVVSVLRTNGISVNYETIRFSKARADDIKGVPFEHRASIDLLLDSGDAILAGVLLAFPKYTGSYDESQKVVELYPKDDPALLVQIPSFSVEKVTLADLLKQDIIKKAFREQGCSGVRCPRKGKIWWCSEWTLTFDGGTFASLLELLASKMGHGVCWDVTCFRTSTSTYDNREYRAVTVRLANFGSGEFVMDSNYLRSMKLKDLLDRWNGTTFTIRPKSEIALEIASRYRQMEEYEKVDRFAKYAIESTKPGEKWNTAYKALTTRLGILDTDKKKREAIEEYQAFISRCEDGRIKGVVESNLLRRYVDLGMKDEAICLLKAIARRGPSDWQRAVILCQSEFPDGDAIEVDGKPLAPLEPGRYCGGVTTNKSVVVRVKIDAGKQTRTVVTNTVVRTNYVVIRSDVFDAFWSDSCGDSGRSGVYRLENSDTEQIKKTEGNSASKKEQR